jgi:Flp pilus assembly pilin Flp
MKELEDMFAPLYVYSYLTASVATAARRRDEKGASFTEYVVLLGVIVALVTTIGFTSLGTKLAGVITNLNVTPGAGT